MLLSPPFVDAHFHMDSTLTYGLPRVNRSGTLLEGIALWGELKPLLTRRRLIERALRYCDWAVAKGLLAIRSHVDVCDPRLLAVGRCCTCASRSSLISTCSSSRFRRTACCAAPGALDNLKRALAMGVDVVGGIPHFERTMAEGAEIRTHPVRAGGTAGAARRHALRRDRRSAVAPYRNAGVRGAATWACRAA